MKFEIVKYTKDRIADVIEFEKRLRQEEDFWGWEKTDPNINKDDKGVSLVLVNTEKGREIFDAIKDRMTVISANLDDCLQPNLQHPSVIHSKRMAFERDYQRKGFEYVMKKYGGIGWYNKIRALKQMIKRIINNQSKI